MTRKTVLELIYASKVRAVDERKQGNIQAAQIIETHIDDLYLEAKGRGFGEDAEEAEDAAIDDRPFPFKA
jgi:hypothetical protein